MRPLAVALAATGACTHDLMFANDPDPPLEHLEVVAPPRWLDVVWSLDSSDSMASDWPHVVEQLREVAKHIDSSTLNVRVGVGFPASIRDPPSLVPSHSGGLARSGNVIQHIESYVPNEHTYLYTLYPKEGERALRFVYYLMKSRLEGPALGAFPDLNEITIFIVISDDNDLSEDPSYVKFTRLFDHLAGQGRSVSYTAIIDTNPGPDSCGRANARHVAAALHTGGRVIPLCAPHPWSADAIDLIEDHLDAPSVIDLPPSTCADATVTFDGRPLATCGPSTSSEECPAWTVSSNPPAAHIPLRERHRTRELVVHQVEGCP